MEAPFIGAAYQARSVNVNAQQCINLYPEIEQTGKVVTSLYGTPGLRLFCTAGIGPINGVHTVSALNRLFAASGTNFYEINSAGVATLRGTGLYGTRPVSMADNGLQIFVADGANGWIFTLATNVWAQITDPDFPGASDVDYQDGYFIFTKPASQQFYITKLLDGFNVNALDFASAEGNPDGLVGLIADHRELWLFGEVSTEIWFNSGAAAFPFERLSGAFLEHGCAAKKTIAKMDNTVFWLGQDTTGNGIIFRAQGYSSQRMSTHAVELAINRYPRIDDAIAYTYQQEGHSFYVISFPSGNETWCFDVATSLWHQRAWFNPVDGSLNRHLSNCHAFFGVNHIVGDWRNGNLYTLDLNYYQDNGAILKRVRTAQHLSNGRLNTRFQSFEVELESGVGLATGQGSDPQIMLQWSDDGGHDYGNEHWSSMGAVGKYKYRAIWRRLGYARDRVFKVEISDPIKVVFVQGDLKFSVGNT